MIKVVTSPELYGIGENEKEVRCFLAGGITGCPDWQSKVIEEIIRLDEEDRECKDKIAKDYTLVLFNPRRENFPGRRLPQGVSPPRGRGRSSP